MKTTATFLVLLALLAAGAHALDDPLPRLPADATVRLKVVADAAGRDRLAAGGWDIAGHALAEGWVEVITDVAGARRLRAAGFAVELIEVRGEPRPPASGPGVDATCSEPDNVHCYTDPAELEAFLDQTVADHPDITRRVALGTSHQGRTIWGLMISDNAAVDEDELTILLSGAHHAREIMTPEVVMDAIDQLTDNYGIDPDMTARVNDYQIWCVPIVNPDGVNRVHTVDDFWRKNARDNNGDSIINSNDGVDLNRNYEWGWGGQCGGSREEIWHSTYRGPTEGSEPETQALVALGRRIRPVFDVEYHSYGEDVFYAMSCDPLYNPSLSTITGGPDQHISRVIAEGYAAEIVQADGGIGYLADSYGSPVDGTGRDHQFHENGAIAFVTEVNTVGEGGFHPDWNTWRDATVEGQRPGWLWLIDRIAGPAVGGHVRDAVTGLPVEADVALDQLSLPDNKRLTSRADTGRFHVIVVEGDYTLRVSAPGYQEAVRNLTVGLVWSPLMVDLVPLGSSLIVADDLENPVTPATWAVGASGDTAIQGVWEWGEPHGTHSGTAPALQFGNPRLDRTSGEARNAWVTGNFPSSTISLDDVSGGATTLSSPSYDLSGWYAVEISWQRWFRNDPSDVGDQLVTEVSVDGGGVWLPLETLSLSTATPDATPAWVRAAVRLDDVAAPGPDVRLRFRANDDGLANTVEAAIDDLAIRGFALATQGQVGGVRLSGAASTVLSWDAVTGAADAVYDVARGDLAALAGSVDLGPLTCIEEDSADTTTSGDADTDVPVPGSGFFYVVRFNLGMSVGEWGRSSDGLERTGAGGCAP